MITVVSIIRNRETLTSHHPVQQKLGIVRTLTYCTDKLISDDGRRQREREKRVGGWGVKETVGTLSGP